MPCTKNLNIIQEVVEKPVEIQQGGRGGGGWSSGLLSASLISMPRHLSLSYLHQFSSLLLETIMFHLYHSILFYV
jgi:hypothetical protein